jgi:hypothetical protein
VTGTVIFPAKLILVVVIVLVVVLVVRLWDR